jgi:anti-sigma B factor antagonist
MAFDLRTDSDGCALVAVTGELDMNTVPELEAAVEPIIGGRPARLVVDVSRLEFADSSAIALWVRWANLVRHLELREPSPFLRRVIARMGLADRLGVNQ